MFRSVPVNEVESYEYVGVNMNKSLNYIEHKDKTYKTAMKLVKLLSRIRYHISPQIANSIYKTMIEPVFFYCNGVFLGDCYSSITKFQIVQDRAFRIVNGNNIQNNWEKIQNIRSRLCVVEVFKILKNLSPECYDGYFSKFAHGKGTRGDMNKLLLPKVKTEAARKSFQFQGALEYNKLPDSLRKEESFLRFKEQCKKLFYS